MFGAYRLLLAVMVILSHAELHVKGVNLGAIAVVNFYIVSGFVMSALASKYYASDAPGFYLDRVMRIMPQYLFYLILAAVVTFGFGINPHDREMSAIGFFANVTVVPLDFYMYSPAIDKAALIPQAWSLGAEFMFYAIVPLLIFSRQVRMALVGAATIVALLAIFGVINTDHFGYRLLCGSLVYFGLGMFLQKGETREMWGLYAVLVIAAAVALFTGLIVVKYNIETSVGVLLGLPVIYFLARKKLNDLDNLLGSASYGAFLNHVLVLSVIQHFFPYDMHSALNRVLGGAAAIVIALPLGWASYQLVERPIIDLRRKLRANRQAALAAMPAADLP